ncbi:MAG TPA: hypothetical protein ACFYEJ_10375 [Candidatus Wujingus californicus]|uniref:hypothetical protein n=2 Tax=Candidatus Wujingus californicus TaxID=3367618 RepID=UPI0040294914
MKIEKMNLTKFTKLMAKIVYSPEEQKYVYKLIDILRSNDNSKIITTKNFLDLVKRDVWDSRKIKPHESNLKKTKPV